MGKALEFKTRDRRKRWNSKPCLCLRVKKTKRCRGVNASAFPLPQANRQRHTAKSSIHKSYVAEREQETTGRSGVVVGRWRSNQ